MDKLTSNNFKCLRHFEKYIYKTIVLKIQRKCFNQVSLSIIII